MKSGTDNAGGKKDKDERTEWVQVRIITQVSLERHAWDLDQYREKITFIKKGKEK